MRKNLESLQGLYGAKWEEENIRLFQVRPLFCSWHAGMLHLIFPLLDLSSEACDINLDKGKVPAEMYQVWNHRIKKHEI